MFCSKNQLGKNLLSKLFIAPKSKDTEGQQFWLFATNPSTNSTVVAIALGSVLAPYIIEHGH